MSALTLLLLCSPLVAMAMEPMLTKDLPMDQFQSFMQGDGVQVVFFYVPEDQLLFDPDLPTNAPHHPAQPGARGSSWEKAQITVDSRQKKFMQVLEASAKALSTYPVTLGKIPCEGNAPAELDDYCDRVDVSYYLHGFRNGQLVGEWPIENLVDVDSIVSYILSVVLVNEIPTISTKEERIQALEPLKGKQNLVLGYHKFIGNYAHRIFMEVAVAQGRNVKFASVDDRKAVLDLPGYDWFDETAVYVFYCKETTASRPCQLIQYVDQLDLVSFNRFISNLDLPATHDVSEQGEFNPFAGKGLHTAVVLYDTQAAAEVKQDAIEIGRRLRGLLGILLVNVDETDGKAYGYSGNEKLPTVALMLSGSDKPGQFKRADQTAIGFLVSELAPVVRGLREKLLDEFADGFDEDLEKRDVDRIYEANVEKEDSPVADAEFYLRGIQNPVLKQLDKTRAGKVIDRTNVPALDEDTFVMDTDNADLRIVLFYLYNDMRAVSALRRYVDAANILAMEGTPAPVAAVECYENTFVCRKQEIWIYPIIRVYRKGQEYVQYDGMFGTDAFITAFKLYMNAAPFNLMSEDDVKKFTNIGSNTAILGLFEENQKEEISTFKTAAEMSWGAQPYGLVTGGLAKKLAIQYYINNSPAVVVLRGNDPYQPFTSVNAPTCPMMLMDIVTQATESLFPELTPSNFLVYHDMEKPMVVLLTDRAESELHDTLAALVKEGRFPGVILAWMHANEAGTAGARILMEYDSTAVLPALALINHNQGKVFLKDMMTPGAVVNWVENALDGNVLLTKRLNGHRWQARNPGYEFLSKTDDFLAKQAEIAKAVKSAVSPQSAPKEFEPVYDAAEEETLREALLRNSPGALHDEF